MPVPLLKRLMTRAATGSAANGGTSYENRKRPFWFPNGIARSYDANMQPRVPNWVDTARDFDLDQSADHEEVKG